MTREETKDRRINIRLDEETFRAIKKTVEADLKTDISSYCRSLLWISTLHDAAVLKIRSAVEQFGRETSTENFEYLLKIKDEIEFIGKFLVKMREDRKKYDEFIATIERLHETIRNEARQYFKKHNELIDYWQKVEKEVHGDEYDADPTGSRIGGKIEI